MQNTALRRSVFIFCFAASASRSTVMPNRLLSLTVKEEEEEEEEDDEDEDEEEGVVMSADEAYTSVLVDVLNSVASSKSAEQIGGFVKGGAVQLLIETINNKGISLDEKALLEEDIPDPQNQGRIAFEIVVGLIEIGEYWTQNESEGEVDPEEADGVMRNAFVDALLEAGEPLFIPFLEMCCAQLRIHATSPLTIVAKILNVIARMMGTGLRAAGTTVTEWPQSVLTFWDTNLDIVAVVGDMLLNKAHELQIKAQNKEALPVPAAEKPKPKKGKKGKKQNKKQKEADTRKAQEQKEGANLIALAEHMSVVETWAELVSSLVLGGLDPAQQAALLMTSVSHSRRKMLTKCKCKACTEIRTQQEELSKAWIHHVANRFFEPQYELVIALLVKSVDLMMNSCLDATLGAGVMEMGMESRGVGECAGLHHAMSALHGLALLNANKLPQSLTPMLLRRAEQMWALMLNDPQGVGTGSDVMFVRILGILQTLTKSAPTVHKHFLRKNMNPPIPTNQETAPNPQDPSSLPSTTQPSPSTTQPSSSTVQPTPSTHPHLLHSVSTFLGACSRRKHSPLLRDALRSVVDTLDLLALEKEMLADEAVNLELDKAIWTSAVTRGLMQGLERDISLALENSHLAADAFRVLSYALSHPDHDIAALVAIELQAGSVGLMEAVKTASLSCHELAFWAQLAWTNLQLIPKEAIAAIEANRPEEELIINTEQDEEDDEVGPGMRGMSGMMGGMMGGMGGLEGMLGGMMGGMGGMEQAFLAQMLSSMMNVDEMGEFGEDDEEEGEYQPPKKQHHGKKGKGSKGSKSGSKHKKR
eukprot:Phypoly_transcript_01680.p1 GENE.Phypoly_transcript_01680~~Phypoly_transcript_01680.p1  ORF type:complete len:815 (+),score=170.21 Phypoly_transcript_01680:639-3083(+)